KTRRSGTDRRDGPKHEGRSGKKAEAECTRALPPNLANMSEQQLQEDCKQRADQVAAQKANPRESQGGTNAATGVQQKGKPKSRRVLITTSQNDGGLPRGVGPLHNNETLVNPGPVLRERNGQGLEVTQHAQPGAVPVVPRTRTEEPLADGVRRRRV